jgi:hypothetical protein
MVAVGLGSGVAVLVGVAVDRGANENPHPLVNNIPNRMTIDRLRNTTGFTIPSEGWI